MTMQQVSKGEFDRRVKLLEQKVQQSANKLINDYKEFVERINSITSDNADFNKYAAIVDRINSCFDTNGQFDGSHIAPLSIETSALSVGQRSQQLTLKNIKFIVDNYGDVSSQDPTQENNPRTNYGVLKVVNDNGDTTGTYGELTHFTLFDKNDNGTIKPTVATFRLEYNNSITIDDGTIHYIYAKLPCNKVNNIYLYEELSGTPITPISLIEISTQQYKIDDNYRDNNKFLYVLLGTISKELTDSNSDLSHKYYRILDLNYGLTTINGRLITTGRIEGSVQNGAYFDLDAGEIGGKIVFNNNNKSSLTDVLDSVYDANGAANTALSNATAYTDGQLSTREEAGWQIKTQKIYIAVPGIGSGGSKPNTPSAPNSIIPIDSNNANTWSKKIPENTNNGSWHYFSCIQSWKEKNNETKELNNSSVIYEETLTILATAIRGTTTIAGGLVLTQVVKAGSGSNSSVLDGTNSAYGYWTGNEIPSIAPARIYKNGKAYFSDLEVNNSYFKIKNERLDFDPTSSGYFYTYIRDGGGTDAYSYVGNVSTACDTSIMFTKSGSFNSSIYDYGIAVKYNKTQGGSTSTVSQLFWVSDSQKLVNGASATSPQYNSIVQVRFFRIKKISYSFTIGNNGFILNSRTTSGFYIYLCIGASTSYSVRNTIISFNAYGADLMYVNKNLLS